MSNTPPAQAPASTQKSFVHHAKLISALTLLSRLFGLAREIAQANYFGTGTVAVAFRAAFIVPNLFRKLFGEGALSAAFIPLYVHVVKHESTEQSNRFAAASMTLLAILLSALTIVGEAIVLLLIVFLPHARPDFLLTLKLTAIMLPYVLLICGTALLSAILQVHDRFGPPAVSPIILSAVHIAVMVMGGYLLHLRSLSHADPHLLIQRQTVLAYWLAGGVLVAGVMQVLMLQPALRASGFRPRLIRSFYTPNVKRMLKLSLPVALGAGVLQLSVLMDKALSVGLAQYLDGDRLATHFTLMGHAIRFPMQLGALARLDVAQFLYQFPLGVFATALGTAIFPALSANAANKDQSRFRAALQHGIELSLFEGFAASAGLILVAEPAIRLLFRHGALPEADVPLIARSLGFYASAIWAFSLLQIINRAYYSLHDTRTPMVMSILNLLANLVVEVPLLWTHLGESAMAVGTTVSFSIQAVLMLYMLDRRTGGLELGKLASSAGKMLVATAVMTVACVGLKASPLYPQGMGKVVSAVQLVELMGTGAAVYLLTSYLMNVNAMNAFLPKQFRQGTG